MKKILAMLAICVISTSVVFAGETLSEVKSIKIKTTAPQQISQRGCCSHHGGVCGCSGGGIRCCDGSMSPSCGCLKEDNDKNNVINKGFKS